MPRMNWGFALVGKYLRQRFSRTVVVKRSQTRGERRVKFVMF